MNVKQELKSILTQVSIWSILFLSCFFTASAFTVNDYKVDNKNSKVTFSGEHVGMVFTGVFEQWQASLVLPPAVNPVITATFNLKFAKTGNFTYDTTLAEGDWFDIDNHAEGRFTSESIEATSDGYKVTGNLELRGITRAQSFNMHRTGNSLTAQFIINRLDYAIGLDSDPKAEWVGRDIVMKLSLKL